MRWMLIASILAVSAYVPQPSGRPRARDLGIFRDRGDGLLGCREAQLGIGDDGSLGVGHRGDEGLHERRLGTQQRVADDHAGTWQRGDVIDGQEVDLGAPRLEPEHRPGRSAWLPVERGIAPCWRPGNNTTARARRELFWRGCGPDCG